MMVKSFTTWWITYQKFTDCVVNLWSKSVNNEVFHCWSLARLTIEVFQDIFLLTPLQQKSLYPEQEWQKPFQIRQKKTDLFCFPSMWGVLANVLVPFDCNWTIGKRAVIVKHPVKLSYWQTTKLNCFAFCFDWMILPNAVISMPRNSIAPLGTLIPKYARLWIPTTFSPSCIYAPRNRGLIWYSWPCFPSTSFSVKNR